MSARYDVIIVGAGSAGAVIATRLSEDPARRVLLLEAGPDYPVLDGTPDDLLNGHWNSVRPHDWRFRAHHTEAGRPHMFPRGRVVGGSSAVNTAIALRGIPEDYDAWAAHGNSEWAWEKVLPYFRSIEHDLDFADDYHGQNGPIPVRRYREDELVNWQAAFLQTCRNLGFPRAIDNNDPDSTGAGPHPMNKQGRLRISTAIAYLATARDRANLTIRGNTHVRRVLLDGDRAIGVEIDQDGSGEAVYADLVVLSAGAIQSPAILIRSGIGGREAMDRLGVPCAVELPGVGEHLLDHPMAGVAFAPVPGACLTDVPVVQVTMRYTASGSDQRNDMQVMPVSFVQSADGPQFIIGACLEQVNGAGRLVLESLNPRAQPRIASHFCEDAEDLRRMVEGIRLAVRIGTSEPLASLHTGIRRPRAAHLASDEALGAWIRRVAGSGYHPCGTAKMGPAQDRMAVTDQYGRVHGVQGLLVGDASIMPEVPRANTNLTSIMIGERVGEWLKDEAVGGGVISRILTPSAGGGTAKGRPPIGPDGVRIGESSNFGRARDAGADYLESRQRADGLVGDVAGGMAGFYKATYALAAAGRARAAGRMAAWIARRAFTAGGDFAGDWERGGLAFAYPYGNAWITAGLQRAGAFNLSVPAMNCLAAMQDPVSGGLYARLEDRGLQARQEVMSSAMVGVSALLCGRLDVADGVARFLRMILAAQPAPARLLCHVYTPERGVITEFPEERAAEFAVIADRPLQAYFMYGIGAAFMTQYSLARGDRGALDDAAAFLLPALNATDAMYETAQVGKVAWGAALLAGVTGDRVHRELALRAANALLAQQNPDGSWDNTGGYTTEGSRDEVTAEFVAIMDWVEQGLCGEALDGLQSPPTLATLLATASAGARR